MPKKDSTKFGLVNMGRLKVLNDTKLSRMSMSRSKRHQFGIIQNLQTSPIIQTSFLVGTFFAGSYRKIALV